MAAAKVILSAERSSGKFSDRVLLLGEGDQVGVGRSTRELRPDTNNAVFDSRVLSKHQATLIFNRGEFLLRDSGSSNGSFINNFRLSKPGEQSLATKIYSKDILRFGSQVNDKNKKVKEKCVIAKVLLFMPNGTEAAERPTTDRLYRPKEEIMLPSADKSPQKQSKVSFDQENLIENKVDKLEKILNEKLSVGQDVQDDLEKQLLDKESELLDKNTETLALEKKVSELKETEEKMRKELEAAKAEGVRMADQLATQAKEQMDSVKVTDLQAELADTKTALKRVTEEAWLVKEKLRVEVENGQKRQDDTLAAQNLATQEKIASMQEELDMSRLQVKQLNDLVSEADEIVKDKEREVVQLTESTDRDRMLIKERDGEYLDLKCLMSEENETVHQIESEMKRLLNIISEDQETILQKEKQVISLQKALRAKDEFLRKESADVSDTKHDIEKMFQQTLEEKNEEINEIEKEMQAIIDEKESEIFELRVALEEKKQNSGDSEEANKDLDGIDEANRQMELLIAANEALKTKMEDLMRIVVKKNEELDELKELLKKEKEQKLADIELIQQELTKNLDARESLLQEKIEKIKLDVRAQEQTESKNETFQKEILVMKVQDQQKDLDIKCLQELVDNKDETLRENAALLEENESEITRLKIEVETSKAAEAQAAENSDVAEEKEKIIAQLQQKVIDEQEASKQIEDELIKLKIEFDNVKDSKAETPTKDSLNDDETAKILRQKDHDIASLRRAIQQEQEIVAHVQLTQEKEIIEKEREIAVLNAILSQERQIILDRETEIGNLLAQNGGPKANGLSPPARPTRKKTQQQPAPLRVPSRGSSVASPPVRIEANRLASLLQATLPSPCQSPRLVTSHQSTLARMIQAASPTDDESTMTFHDALSDDEDVLIADLEMDEEEDDRRHRKSDIVDLDSVSLS